MPPAFSLCSFLGFHRQIAAPFALFVSCEADAHAHQLLALDEGEQTGDGLDTQEIDTGEGQGHTHQPQHTAIQKHQEQRIATGAQGGHKDDVEQPAGNANREQPHHGHRSCRHRRILQPEQHHQG